MEGKADAELSDIQGSRPMGQLFAKSPSPPPTEAADDSVPQCGQSGEAGGGEKAPALGNLETDADEGGGGGDDADVGEEGVQMDGGSGAGAIVGYDAMEEEGFRVDECVGKSAAGGDDAAGEDAVQINEHPHLDTTTLGDSDEVEEESVQIDEYPDRVTAAGNDAVEEEEEEEEENVQIDEYPETATAAAGNGTVEEEGVQLDGCPDTATCGDKLEEEGAQVDEKRDNPDMTAAAGDGAGNEEDSQINECVDMAATDGDHAVEEEGVQIDECPDTDVPVIAGDGSVEEEDLQIKESPDTTVASGDDAVEENGAKFDECPDMAPGDGAAKQECLQNDEYPDAVSVAVGFMEEEGDQIDDCSDTVAATGNNEVEEEGGQITEYPDATTTIGGNCTVEGKVAHIDGYPDAATATHDADLDEEDVKIGEYSDMVDTIGNDGCEEEGDRVEEHPDPATITVDDAREEEGVQIDEYPVTAADAGISAVEEEGAQIDEYTASIVDAVVEEDAQIDEYPSKSTAAGSDAVEEEDDQVDEYPDTSTAAGDDAVEEEDARADEYPDTSIAPGNDALEEDAQFDEYPYTTTTAVDDVEEAEQMDEETDEHPVSVRRGGGRRKRGRPPKQQAGRASVRRKDDEEVCFICFDGGELVVCDRRGCPKVYHPACVNRDEAFFRAKGRWNCGWHICSNCEKSARFMCYTCTHSLCNGCVKESEFVCVRGNKGFCQTCLSTVMLIEKNENGNETMDGVDFNDKNSWEYLFKDYWLDLKRKLSLTLEELSAAESQKKGSLVVVHGEESSGDAHDGNGDQGASSDSSAGHHDETKSSRKRFRKRSKHTVGEKEPKKEVARALSKRSSSVHRDGQSSSRKKMKKLLRDSASYEGLAKGENVGTSISEGGSWASKELLDFVAHMKDGDRSVLSQFDVQALLLEYIKRNNLRDPRRKSQIVCDPLLQNLFGKQRVGHFEMLKLLESHFLMNEASPVDTDDNQGGVVDPDPSQMDVEANSEASTIMSSEKRRKSRKKIGERGPQTNLDDYAAIDVHNINLMYLRRNLMEDLIDNIDALSEKVVGSFVRIRISGTGQRQDIYRLVQVIGTGKAAEKYKTGKKMTDITLEILNLDKKEVITVDIISNQEFSEEECKRLRQSIKCGLIGRLTVGEVQEKARVLQAVRVNDWIESEKLRLGHLRDRASEKGHRKELRECVEKLQLLSTPEERIRRLNEVPEIHADPNMDPDYETSEEGEPEVGKKENYGRPRDSYLMKGKEVISPAKISPVSSNNWNSARKILKVNWDPNRSTLAEGTYVDSSTSLVEKANGYSWNKDKDARLTSNLTTLKGGANATNIEVILNNNQHGQSPGFPSGTPSAAPASEVAATLNINESEKIWHYVDPSGKTQGPFSMTQLRKWNTTGYFPPNLRIWKSSEKQEDAISLSNALTGKFQNDHPELEVQHSSSSISNKTETRTNLEGGFGGSKNTFLAGSLTKYANVIASQSNTSCSHTSVNELVKADKFDAQASASSATKVGGGRLEISPGGWESSKDSNAWSRHSYGPNEPRPVASFAGTPYRSPSDQGRGSQSGTAGAWMGGEDHGSNHRPMELHTGRPGYGKPVSQSSSSSQQSSGGSWKGQPGYASSTQWGANRTDLPTPTPHPNTGDFTVVRDALSKEPINVEDENSGLVESVLLPRTANTTERFISPKLGNKVDGPGNFQAAYPELPPKAASADMSKSTVVGSGKSKVDPVVDVGLGNSAVPAFFSPQGEALKRSVSISAEGLVAQRTADTDSDLVPEGAIPEASRLSVQHRTDSGFQQKPDDLTLSYLLAKHVSNQSNIQKSQASLSDPTPSSCNFGPAQDTRNAQQPMMLQTVTNMPYSTLENNQEKHLVMSSGSNQMLSSQMRATTSMEHAHISNTEFGVGANGQNTGWVAAPAVQQNAKLVVGQAQESGNMSMGTSVQGNVNMGWGMLPQVNMSMAWGTPAQGVANMGLGTPPQNLMMNQGWMAPNQGNTNTNLLWATPGQGGTNPAAVWGAQFPGNTTGWMAPTQGNANSYPGWVAPTLGNTNQNAGWGTPAQANMILNPGNGTGQGNLNMNWTSPNGNPGNWSNQQTETGGRHSGQGDNLQGSDSGHSSGRPSWNRMQSGGEGGSSQPPSGQKGVCRFHENGHCKKGAFCNYFHS